MLNDSDRDVRNRAAWALGAIGKQAKRAIPALQTASRDPQTSDVAEWALERIKR